MRDKVDLVSPHEVLVGGPRRVEHHLVDVPAVSDEGVAVGLGDDGGALEPGGGGVRVDAGDEAHGAARGAEEGARLAEHVGVANVEQVEHAVGVDADGAGDVAGPTRKTKYRFRRKNRCSIITWPFSW